MLDEPVAGLDPLARREFLQGLMEFTAEHAVSVVLSSHLVADLERVCDYLILVAEGRVQLCGEVDELLATHRRLSGPRRDSARLPVSQQVIEEGHTDRQSTLLVRTEEPIIDPAWSVEEVSLEDIVLAYMGRPSGAMPSWRGSGDDLGRLAPVPHAGARHARPARRVRRARARDGPAPARRL